MAGTGVTWVQCSPLLKTALWVQPSSYLTLQRWTSALPKSHRWGAVHLLCVPVLMRTLFMVSRDCDLPGPTAPDAATTLCGIWCQDQLSCLCMEHLPAPGVTVKVQEYGGSHLQGLFMCFFVYWYWYGLVLFYLQVWMREIQCSFTEHSTARLHQMTLKRLLVASVDWLVQVMSWEGAGDSKGKIHPSGITCMRAHDFLIPKCQILQSAHTQKYD